MISPAEIGSTESWREVMLRHTETWALVPARGWGLRHTSLVVSIACLNCPRGGPRVGPISGTWFRSSHPKIRTWVV